MLQDKRFKNRELQIMKMMDHPNVVDLRHCFFTNEKAEARSLRIWGSKAACALLFAP